MRYIRVSAWIDKEINELVLHMCTLKMNIFTIQTAKQNLLEKCASHILLTYMRTLKVQILTHVDKSKYEYHTLIRCIAQITYVIINIMSIASLWIILFWNQNNDINNLQYNNPLSNRYNNQDRTQNNQIISFIVKQEYE